MLSTDDRMKIKKREFLINSYSLLFFFFFFRILVASVCVVVLRNDLAGRHWTGDDRNPGTSWLKGWILGDGCRRRSSCSAARTSPSLKNKDLFLALDMPAAQNNKALNERSSTTLQSQALAYFCPQTSSVSLVLFIHHQTENLEQQARLVHNMRPQCTTRLKRALMRRI